MKHASAFWEGARRGYWKGSLAGLIMALVWLFVRIDFQVFKAKYPQAGKGAYVWHRLIGD